MKKILGLFVFLWICCQPDAGETYISGNLKNCRNRKITIRYDLYNIVGNSRKSAVIKTDKNGRFNVILSDVRYFTVLNFIRIGTKKIYFSLFPDDSVFIHGDSKNLYGITFEGTHAQRNYFINEYYHNVIDRKNEQRASTPDIFLVTLRHYFLSDSTLLANYAKKNSIDTFFTSYFLDVLKINYLNELITSKFDFSAQFREMASSLNLQDHYLEYYLIYYSVISGYVSSVMHKQFNLYTLEGLKEGLRTSDEILMKPFSEVYQAFMIGWFVRQPFNKKVRSGPEIKQISRKYLAGCTNEVVKEELKEMLKLKKIEL